MRRRCPVATVSVGRSRRCRRHSRHRHRNGPQSTFTSVYGNMYGMQPRAVSSTPPPPRHTPGLPTDDTGTVCPVLCATGTYTSDGEWADRLGRPWTRARGNGEKMWTSADLTAAAEATARVADEIRYNIIWRYVHTMYRVVVLPLEGVRGWCDRIVYMTRPMRNVCVCDNWSWTVPTRNSPAGIVVIYVMYSSTPPGTFINIKKHHAPVMNRPINHDNRF